MKKFLLLAGLILTMTSQCACPINKLANRQLNKLATNEQTAIKSREQENIQLFKSQSLTDSGEQVYRLTIFPTDSFNFSLEKGFIGKAAKLEFSSSIRQLKMITDSTTLMLTENRETKANVITKKESKDLNHSKIIEKTGFKWWQVGLAVGGMLLFLWLYQQLRK